MKHCQPINLNEAAPKIRRTDELPLYFIAARIFNFSSVIHTFCSATLFAKAQEFLELLLLYGASCTQVLSITKYEEIDKEQYQAQINARNSLLICDHLNLAYQYWQNEIERDFHILSALRLSYKSGTFLEKYIKFNIEIERNDDFKEFFKCLINRLKYYSADLQFKNTYERCKPHIERFEQLQYNKLALEEKNEKSITPSSSAQDSKKPENSSQGSNLTSSLKFSSALAAPLPSSPSSSSAQVQVHVNTQTPAQQQTSTPL